MKVRMERVLKVRDYETLRYDVEVNSDDLVPMEGESLTHKVRRAHLLCYQEVLAFQVFHGVLVPDQAKTELERFRKGYKVGDDSTTES